MKYFAPGHLNTKVPQNLMEALVLTVHTLALTVPHVTPVGHHKLAGHHQGYI